MIPVEVLLIEITKAEPHWTMDYNSTEHYYCIVMPAKNNNKGFARFQNRNFGAMIREAWSYYYGEIETE